MNILWDPEIATCTECEDVNVSRRYTSNGTHTILCYVCWHKIRRGFVLSDLEWIDDSCMIVEYEKSEKYKDGTTQERIFH